MSVVLISRITLVSRKGNNGIEIYTSRPFLNLLLPFVIVNQDFSQTYSLVLEQLLPVLLGCQITKSLLSSYESQMGTGPRRIAPFFGVYSQSEQLILLEEPYRSLSIFSLIGRHGSGHIV